jgi:adenylate cyclase class 2
MIEVELKYQLDDPEALLAQLTARGFVAGDETTERDIYFAHPGRDFASTNEALRLRWDGSEATMTYKGPLLDAVSKSREECEVSLAGKAAMDECRTVLERLGFKAVRPIEKRRTKFAGPYEGRDVIVSIDDVAGLGLFVELETLVEEAGWQAARTALEKLAAQFGLKQSERRSYLELLMQVD